MLIVRRLKKNILFFVILFSCFSGISYASHLEAFLPISMFSISLDDGNTTSKGNFCVAFQNADPNALKLGIDWACGPGLANCSFIQPGQACYVANNLAAIASYAYDAYYQANQARGGTCFFNNTATLTSNDPSSGSCIFPGSFGSGTNTTGGSGGGGSSTNSSGGSGNSSSPNFAPPFPPYVPLDDGENRVLSLQVHKLVYFSVLVFLCLQIL